MEKYTRNSQDQEGYHKPYVVTNSQFLSNEQVMD